VPSCSVAVPVTEGKKVYNIANWNEPLTSVEVNQFAECETVDLFNSKRDMALRWSEAKLNISRGVLKFTIDYDEICPSINVMFFFTDGKTK